MSKPSDVKLCPCGCAWGEHEGFHRKDNHDCRYHHGLWCKTCITVRQIYGFVKASKEAREIREQFWKEAEK